MPAMSGFGWSDGHDVQLTLGQLILASVTGFGYKRGLISGVFDDSTRQALGSRKSTRVNNYMTLAAISMRQQSGDIYRGCIRKPDRPAVLEALAACPRRGGSLACWV